MMVSKHQSVYFLLGVSGLQFEVELITSREVEVDVPGGASYRRAVNGSNGDIQGPTSGYIQINITCKELEGKRN